MSSSTIALAIWEDLMTSRRYRPGRHQSFPGSAACHVVIVRSVVQSREAYLPRKRHIAVQFPNGARKTRSSILQVHFSPRW